MTVTERCRHQAAACRQASEADLSDSDQRPRSSPAPHSSRPAQEHTHLTGTRTVALDCSLCAPVLCSLR